jgi:hypothetical protein
MGLSAGYAVETETSTGSRVLAVKTASAHCIASIASAPPNESAGIREDETAPAVERCADPAASAEVAPMTTRSKTKRFTPAIEAPTAQPIFGDHPEAAQIEGKP